MISFSWKFDIDHIYTENSTYKPSSTITKRGKRHHFLYKDPRIATYQENIINGIESIIGEVEIPTPDSTFGFINEFRLGIDTSRYWNIDVTNCVKAIEDAYIRFFHKHNRDFDDSQVIANVAVKLPVNNSYYIGL